MIHLNKYYIGCLLTVALLGIALQANSNNEKVPYISLVLLKGNRGEVTLKNTTTQVINMYKYNLPWEGMYSIIIIMVKADATGSIIEKLLPIDDPGTAVITIKPGEMLKGFINLTDRFPKLDEITSDRDVILFWSYQLQIINKPPLERVNGSVIIPKKRSH